MNIMSTNFYRINKKNYTRLNKQTHHLGGDTSNDLIKIIKETPVSELQSVNPNVIVNYFYDRMIEDYELLIGSNDIVIDKLLGKGVYGETYLLKLNNDINYKNGKKENIKRDTPIVGKITTHRLKPTLKTDSLKNEVLSNVILDNIKCEDKKNIMKFFGFVTDYRMLIHGEHKFVDIIFLEYIQGEPLDKYIANYNSTNADGIDILKKILSWVHSLENTLSCFHHNDVVHRDIKIDNIMISNHESLEIPKLVDYGLTCKFVPTCLHDFNENHTSLLKAYLIKENDIDSYLQMEKINDKYALMLTIVDMLYNTFDMRNKIAQLHRKLAKYYEALRIRQCVAIFGDVCYSIMDKSNEKNYAKDTERINDLIDDSNVIRFFYESFDIIEHFINNIPAEIFNNVANNVILVRNAKSNEFITIFNIIKSMFEDYKKETLNLYNTKISTTTQIEHTTPNEKGYVSF